MAPPQFSITGDPAAEDIAFLEDQVIAFNFLTTGLRDGRLLASFVRDEAGAILAGISGFTWGGYCRVEWLWVRVDMRQQGYGKHLMEAVEAEARARGCTQIVLDTHSFQAPGFYQKLGYEIIGVSDNCPRGYQEIHLRKSLA
jgi:ribosomal protein S18 acetylase RimI-like enzyme